MIKLDQSFDMIYAEKTNTADFRKHDRYGNFELELREANDFGYVLLPGTFIEVEESGRVWQYEEHGWWMWGAWFLAGYLLLFTKRYAKERWVLLHYLHALLGYATTAVTIIFAFKIMNFKGGFEMGPHSLSGMMVTILTMCECLLGVAAALTKKCNKGKEVWKAKETSMKVSKIHKVLGFLLLFFSNITIFTGTANYTKKFLDEKTLMLLGIINFTIFVGAVSLIEYCYRSANKTSKVVLDSQKLV